MNKEDLIMIVIILWLSLIVLILPSTTFLILEKFGFDVDKCSMQEVNYKTQNES